jgi:hypothetical protein
MANTIRCLKIIQADLQNKFGPDAKKKHLRGDGAKEFGVIDTGKKVTYNKKTESIYIITYHLMGSDIARYARDEGINLI